MPSWVRALPRRDRDAGIGGEDDAARRGAIRPQIEADVVPGPHDHRVAGLHVVRGVLKSLPGAGRCSRVGVVTAVRDIERGGHHAIFELFDAKTGAPRRAHGTTSFVIGYWACGKTSIIG